MAPSPSFTFTVAPETGASLSLSRFIIRCLVEETPSIRMSLLTSKTGFGESDSLLDVTIDKGAHRAKTLDLRGIAALRKLRGPTEVRLYLWGDQPAGVFRFGGRRGPQDRFGKHESDVLLTGAVQHAGAKGSAL